MATQIEQYRDSFAKMPTAQKKAFIDRLRGQLAGKNNPEYSRFLNECVQKYNIEARGGSTSSNDFDNLLDDDNLLSNNVVVEPSERLLAHLIDTGVGLGIMAAVSSLYLFVIVRFIANFLDEYTYMYEEDYGIPIVIIWVIILLFVMIAFQLKYWKKGASFGKDKRGLTVVKKDTGKKISTGDMFLREVFGKQISGMVFSLGYIWILLDKDKQGWHDKLVSSIVVKK